MNTSLPTIISDYMAASDSGTVDAIVTCFTDDAEVDEVPVEIATDEAAGADEEAGEVE